MSQNEELTGHEQDTEVHSYFPDYATSPESPADSPKDSRFPIHRPPIYRQYTEEDAKSLLGGEEISLETDSSELADKNEKTHPGLGKVFLFSFPLGGLSGIISGFKLSALPFGSKDDEEDEEMIAIRNRINRQLSVTTVQEARHFSALKGLDNVRMRAMKYSLKENISELVPDFLLKSKHHESVYDELDGPILVMGGYRGSVLRETATGRRAWAPIKAGLNLRSVNLFIGPKREDELNVTDLIYPDGVLKNIGPVDLCKKFMKKLDNGKTTVKDFGYDWRVSLDISGDHLIEALEKLYIDTGRKTIVIAHSMGGLVAHGAMQRRPDLFRGLIYVGTPSECFNILGPLRYGDSVMFSDRILTFETNFMMRSSFSFLPLSGRVFCNKETGENYDLDFFNPDTWVEYNLNPLVSKFRKEQELNSKAELTEGEIGEMHPKPSHTTSSLSSLLSKSSISSKLRQFPSNLALKSKPQTVTNAMMQKIHKQGKVNEVTLQLYEVWMDYKFSLSFSEAYEYLAETLKRTKKFVLGLDYNPELASEYPPLAMVYGNTVPSIRGSYVKSSQEIMDGSYYEFFYGRGDGVVHQRWLMPEDKGFERHDPKTGTGHIVGKFASNRGHVDLMTDHEAMAEALSAIIEADKTWHQKSS